MRRMRAFGRVHELAFGVATILLAVGVAKADPIPAVQSALNMQIIGHSNLNGAGHGGEGLALRQYPDGRRVLFLAHESAPMCVSIIDVTRPEDPTVITQIPVPAPQFRCNSLGLSGTTMTVAHQTDKQGQPGAGMELWDVADPAHPRQVGFFDTSGPHSRGVHYLWFVDGHFAYLSTGAADFTPHDPLDDQFFMIVDVSDPAHLKEAGRWWLPGTRVGDEAPPPARVSINSGGRMHTPVVAGDRAYVGWIDGGWVILDIADKAHPKLVAQQDIDTAQSKDASGASAVAAAKALCCRSCRAGWRSRPRKRSSRIAGTGRSATRCGTSRTRRRRSCCRCCRRRRISTHCASKGGGLERIILRRTGPRRDNCPEPWWAVFSMAASERIRSPIRMRQRRSGFWWMRRRRGMPRTAFRSMMCMSMRTG